MSTYVALLRGINLGPSNKIAMPQLRTTVSELGYADVSTYINSGNVIFASPKRAATLAAEIGQAITETFGYRVDVVVRSATQLAKVLAGNPFPDGDPSQVTVAFLTGPPGAQAAPRVAEMATAYEPFVFAGHEVYVNYTHGIGTSKLAARFSAVIGVSSTVRNLRTVRTLVELTAG